MNYGIQLIRLLPENILTLFALIVMVSVGFVAVLSSRVVLPLVDEVEARLPEGRQVR